jgi:hypothetical protein
MWEEGAEGGGREGKEIQKSEGGGRVYEGRGAISGHFFAKEAGVGGGKTGKTGGLQSQDSTTDHFSGRPKRTLVRPETTDW